MDCLFCKIIAGEIPSAKVYSDDHVYAFKDINPQAPVHILIVPREHIASADEITAENSAAVAHIFEAIPKIAAAAGLTNGYRVSVGKASAFSSGRRQKAAGEHGIRNVACFPLTAYNRCCYIINNVEKVSAREALQN